MIFFNILISFTLVLTSNIHSISFPITLFIQLLALYFILGLCDIILNLIKYENFPSLLDLRNKILQVSNGMFRLPVFTICICVLLCFLPHHFNQVIVNIYNTNGRTIQESIIHHINTKNLFIFNVIIHIFSLLFSIVLYINAFNQPLNFRNIT